MNENIFQANERSNASKSKCKGTCSILNMVPNQNDSDPCHPGVARTHRGGLSAEYPAQIGAWDQNRTI